MDNQNDQQNTNPNIIQPDPVVPATGSTTPPDQPGTPLQSPVSPPPSPVPPKKSKKTLIIILLILLLLSALGVAYFLLIANKDEDSKTTTTSQSATDDKQDSTELIRTTYTTHESTSGNPVEVTVEHPADWKIEKDEDTTEGEYTVKGNLRIISPSGNVLAFSDASLGGYGGGCYEDVEVTLVKRIQTKSDKYVFTQLSDIDPNDDFKPSLDLEPIREFPNESYADDLTRYNDLEEGEKFKGNCNAVFIYPAIKNSESDSTVFVNVRNEDQRNIDYETVKDDTEFIKMLESLEVKESNQ